VIRNLGILAGAGLSIDAGIFATSRVTAQKYVSNTNSINHILIACQENHSFDNYFGYYPGVGAFGVPSNYSQPDGKGGTVTPQHALLPITTDPSHTWQSIHSEWNNGTMDGFYTTDGSTALNYYDGSDLSYYFSLADSFTLCGFNYRGIHQ
jgi:phospholipase C